MISSFRLDFRERLGWLIGVRLLILFLLGGVLFSLHLAGGARLLGIPIAYYPILAGLFASGIYYTLFRERWAGDMTRFAVMQLAVDLALTTWLVAVTGSIESPFSFLYILLIVWAGAVLLRRGALAAAASSTLLYEFLAIVNSGGLRSPARFLFSGEGLQTFVLNSVAFFTVALLSSHLAEKLRRTGEALQEQKQDFRDLSQFLESVLQSMTNGLFTTDLAGRVTTLNRAGEEITGYRREEIRGRPCAEVFPWEAVRQFYADISGVRAPRRFEAEFLRKAGKRLSIGGTTTTLRRENGSVAGLVVTFQDLTKIRELEEEMRRRERLAMVGELAAGMAHEIRNPLASLSGSMQELHRDLAPKNILDGENRRLMEIALREAERLDKLVKDFLSFARPTPPRRAEHDLRQLISETVALLRRSGECGREIEFDIRLPEPLTAEVDPDQMRQVFWNLGINALEAMGPRGRLDISGQVLPEEGAIEIVFRDTGSGIAPQDLPRIFTPFFTTKTTGSGLGLAIVRRVVDDHGGRISVSSRGNGGTRFTLRLSSSTISPRSSEQPAEKRSGRMEGRRAA